MNELYLNWRQTDPRFNKAEAWPAQQFPDAQFRFFRDAGCLVCALAVFIICQFLTADLRRKRMKTCSTPGS